MGGGGGTWKIYLMHHVAQGIWRRKVNENIEQKLGVEDLPDISCSTKNMKKENG